MADLEPIVIKQIEEFFVNYQKVRDIQFTPLGHADSMGAKKMLERARSMLLLETSIAKAVPESEASVLIGRALAKCGLPMPSAL